LFSEKRKNIEIRSAIEGIGNKTGKNKRRKKRKGADRKSKDEGKEKEENRNTAKHESKYIKENRDNLGHVINERYPHQQKEKELTTYNFHSSHNQLDGMFANE